MEKTQRFSDLITIYNALGNLKIYYNLDASCHSLFDSIVRCFNEQGFPQFLEISNKELSLISGISMPNIYRVRQRLLDHRVNNNWIVEYQAQGTRNQGKYKLNYPFFNSNSKKYDYYHGDTNPVSNTEDYYHGDTNLLPHYYQNDTNTASNPKTENPVDTDNITDSEIGTKLADLKEENNNNNNNIESLNIAAMKLQKRVADRYGIIPWHKDLPQLQFYITSLQIYPQDYIENKIDTLYQNLSPKKIESTLRNWLASGCENHNKQAKSNITEVEATNSLKHIFSLSVLDTLDEATIRKAMDVINPIEATYPQLIAKMESTNKGLIALIAKIKETYNVL